jgi:hypothetical protein
MESNSANFHGVITNLTIVNGKVGLAFKLLVVLKVC